MSDTKSILVTGGSSGIGRATALHLNALGHRVCIFGRRKSLLHEVQQHSANADNMIVCAGDITNVADVDAAIAATVAAFGRLDILFNNAGMSAEAASVADADLDQFKQVVDVNLVGAFIVAQAGYKQMKGQSPQGGRIINNGSISAYVPRPNGVAYNMTKHAILGLTKSISLEGRADNIACSQIDIGNTATDMTEKMEKGMLQADGSIRPEPTFDVAHVAEAVAYMSALPLNTNVQNMTLMATNMPFIGRG